MKKGLILLLALLMLAPTFASCAGNTPPEDKVTTASAETTAPAAENTTEGFTYMQDDLPDDLDFDGAEIPIRTYTNQMPELLDETENDIVAVAVQKRNQQVEERLKIKLAPYDPGIDWNSFGPDVLKQVLAGNDTFDIILGHQDTIYRQQHRGTYANLYDSLYLDFEKPWWFSDYISSLQWFPEHIFMISGDANYQYVGGLACLFMNKSIITDTLTDIGPDGLYQAVIDGVWTIDMFTEYVRITTADLDGDQVMTVDDRYGMVDPYNFEPFYIGMDIVLSERDEFGEPYISLDHPQNFEMVDKLIKLYQLPGYLWYKKLTDGDSNEAVFSLFTSDKAAFLLGDLKYSYDKFRNMESEYGILPCPKLTESQRQYKARSDSATSLYTVNSLCTNLDRATAILEALASASHRLVMPVYFEKALKTKYTHDSSSSKVIDILHDAAFAEFADIYGDDVQNPIERMGDIARKGENTLASGLAGIADLAQNALEKKMTKMKKQLGIA